MEGSSNAQSRTLPPKSVVGAISAYARSPASSWSWWRYLRPGRSRRNLFVVVWLAASLAVLWEWQRLVGGENLSLRFAIGAAALIAVASIAHPKPSAFYGEAHVDAGLVFVGIALATVAQAVLTASGRRIWAAGGHALRRALRSWRSWRCGSRIRIGSAARSSGCSPSCGRPTSFAYFGGRLIGGPKLWPRVSPSKTWSGTMTGVTGWRLDRNLRRAA